MPWHYYAVKLLIKILLVLFARVRIEGESNIPRRGPLLVVSNHLSVVDPPLVGFVVSRKMAFMAKEELFRYCRLLTCLIRSFGAFPIHRGRLDREALRQAERALADGLAFIMFPEGRRSRNAELGRIFPGVALVAMRNGAPILPVGISGTEKFERLSQFWRRPEIRVNVGSPFRLPQVDGKMTKKELIQLADVIAYRIAELLPPKYRGNHTGEGVLSGVKD